MELFVDDLDASVAFYTRVLGFEVTRAAPDYVSIRHGGVVLGLGPVAKLPERGDGPGFTRERMAADAVGKGAGVEIVFEVDGAADAVRALYETCRSHGAVVEGLQERPWGLLDFRVTDPDGYYVRITHGDAAG